MKRLAVWFALAAFCLGCSNAAEPRSDARDRSTSAIRSVPTQSPSPTWPIPIPTKQTLAVLHRYGDAQRYRAYTGRRPPVVSEARAIGMVRGDRIYSLGLRDIGMVKTNGEVTWFHVWVIASDTFVKDGNSLSLGGRLTPSGIAATASPSPRPVWSRGVTMIDTSTGKFVLAQFH